MATNLSYVAGILNSALSDGDHRISDFHASFDAQYPLIGQLRAQGYLSALFPSIWIFAQPAFWLGCVIVRLVEGKERQGFSPNEALHTLINQIILGILWSFGPIMNRILPPLEVDETMTFGAFLWKTLAGLVIVDLTFYLIHRAMHDVPWLRWIHAKHHALRANHTVWGGLDEGPLETLTIFAYVSLPLVFFRATPLWFILFVGGGALQTALMHGTGRSAFPPWPLVEGTFHHGHHVHLRKNYSGVTVMWDYVFGTALTAEEMRAAQSKFRKVE